MPNRTIREGILHSPRVRSLEQGAQLFFYKLLLVVDDYGRFSATPYDLAAKCDVPQQSVPGWLAATEAADLVATYEANGVQALAVKRFNQFKRAKYSKWPAPPGEPENIQQSPKKTEKTPLAIPEPEPEPNPPAPPAKPVRVRPPEAKGLSLDDLVADGLEAALAADWLAHRRAKKALLTRSAWDGLKREAAKAHCSVGDAVSLAMQRGWTGFNCTWLERENSERNRKAAYRETPYQAAQREFVSALAPGAAAKAPGHQHTLEDVTDVSPKGD